MAIKKVLGIDPGLNNTGWGLIEVEGYNIRLLGSGTIHSGAEYPLHERLLSLRNGLVDVVREHKPSISAIEETFVNKNALTSLKLGHVRGAIMLTLVIEGIEIHSYAANLIKKTLVGRGMADKLQVKNMVEYILPGVKISSTDASDALAVAICHAHHIANQYGANKILRKKGGL